MTTVVHCKKSNYDVYIGRGRDPKTGEVSPWGNPFRIGPDGTREQVINKYREWIKTQPQLLVRLPELKDKVLGCFCTPQLCHGHILAALADGLEV